MNTAVSGKRISSAEKEPLTGENGLDCKFDGHEKEALELLAKHYNIIQVVPRGGFAMILKVEKGGKHYAAKFLNNYIQKEPKYRQLLQQEAIRTKLAGVHPNSVTYHDLLEGKVLLTEWCGGESLDSQLRSGYRFNHQEIRAYLENLGEALLYASSQGIIHRDVKPLNIVKGVLLDWGLTDEVQQACGRDQILGTLGYIAPEVITGKEPTSFESDLYSLGIVGMDMVESFTAKPGTLPKKKHIRPDPEKQQHQQIIQFNLPDDLERALHYLVSHEPRLRRQGLPADLSIRQFI